MPNTHQLQQKVSSSPSESFLPTRQDETTIKLNNISNNSSSSLSDANSAPNIISSSNSSSMNLIHHHDGEINNNDNSSTPQLQTSTQEKHTTLSFGNNYNSGANNNNNSGGGGSLVRQGTTAIINTSRTQQETQTQNWNLTEKKRISIGEEEKEAKEENCRFLNNSTSNNHQHQHQNNNKEFDFNNNSENSVAVDCNSNNCYNIHNNIDNIDNKKISGVKVGEAEDYLKTLSSRIYHLNPIINKKNSLPLDNTIQEISKSSSLSPNNNNNTELSKDNDKITTIISSVHAQTTNNTNNNNTTNTTEMNFSNSPTPQANVPYSANAHYSLNFFNLPLEGTSIPKAWHSLLKVQASTILFTVYSGYVIQTMYVFREQSHDINATFWMLILGVLTILVNSGRLIRMDKAENTIESKAIIIFNVVSFSIRFLVMQKNRVLMLSNSLATIAVMSKNTAHSKGDPFWSMLPIVSMAFHYFLAGLYKIYALGWTYTLDVIFEYSPTIYTILIFGLFIVFGNVQLSSECDQLQETTDRLKLALEAKSNFVSHLSHEFRTPTLSSLGSIELIKETNLTKEQREHIETIESAENILLTLIEDILLFVKSEHETKSKIQTNTKQVFCLRNCLQSVQEIMKSYAKKFVVDVKVFADDLEQNVFVKMNQARMSQILVNLLTNAVKASHPQQSVELHCKIIPSPPNVITEKSHQWFEFKVVDYGVGIPKSKQEFIFQPFGQLHNLNESIFPSSGLGLSTCLNIVRSMNGCITLESEENHGSTFTIQIPIQIYNMDTLDEKEVVLSAQGQTVDFSIKRQIDIQNNYLDQFEKADSYVKNAEISKPNTDNIQIIIAEDNAINRKVLTKMLRSLGFEVDVAVDGRQLVEKIDPIRHKLVITDMHMPFMSGIEASKVIKSKYKDMKIIMLTADALTNAEYYASVVDAVICKPCTRNDLQNGIQAMLGEGEEIIKD